MIILRFKLIPLFFLILIFLIPIVHASSYIGYTTSNLGTSTCGTNCTPPPSTTRGNGMVLKSPLAGQIQSVFVFLGALAPNQLVISTFPSGSTPTSTGFACGANTCQLANSGQGFTVQLVTTLAGLTVQTGNTISGFTPVSVSANQWVSVLFMFTTSASTSGMIMLCGLNCGSGGGSGISGVTMDSDIDFATTSPVVGTTYNTVGSSSTGDMVGGTFSTVATGSTGNTITQCYGNCGSPPVTLANTNTTHSINFNQSITIFYQAQSQLQGAINNVTVAVAKTYTNNLNVFLALYVVDVTCTGSANPFTPTCPGLIQTSSFIGAANPNKGKLTVPTNIPIQNGQWMGVAVSANFGGFDINDTNTDVTLSQAPGNMPVIINNFKTVAGITRPAIFAFATGTQIIVTPTPIPLPPICITLTCQLFGIIDGFGMGRTAGGLFFMMIWWGITTFALVFITSPKNDEGVRQPGQSYLPGETHILTLLIFAILLTAMNVLPVWIPILIFFVVAIMMSGMIMGFVHGRRGE